MLFRLWRDESGVMATSELILMSTIIVIGVIVGLSTFRNHMVQELGDTAAAVAALNQSYSFSGATVGGFTVAGSSFTDATDACDTGDPAGGGAQCIDVGVAASEE